MKFQTILQSQFTRYPALQVQDVYKLIIRLHQAVTNPSDTRTWLEREWVNSGDGPPEPIHAALE